MTAPLLALPPAGRDRPRNLLNLGALLVGGSVTMAIGGLIAAYLNVRALSPEWPPPGVELDNYLGVMLTLTMVLSSVTAEWAVFSVRRGNRSQSIAAWSITLGLGLSFLNLLWYLFSQLGFGPGDSAFAVIFYALLGAGGAVVALGCLAVIAALARTLGSQIGPGEHEQARATAIYWQVAVVAWLAVFVALYIQHRR